MCNRARFDGEPETIFGSAAKLFDERPRDNRFHPQELRPKARSYVIREQDGERAWDVMSWDVLGGKAPYPMINVRNLELPQWRRLAAIFAVAGFWRQTAEGRSFAMVTCDANELLEPIHPKAMITFLHPEDVTTWLHAPAEDAVALQQPYPADRMKVRGPVFPTRRAAEPITP